MNKPRIELDKHNIYYEETEEGLKIYVHKKENDREKKPLGYIYGDNYLFLRNKKSETDKI